MGLFVRARGLRKRLSKLTTGGNISVPLWRLGPPPDTGRVSRLSRHMFHSTLRTRRQTYV